MPKNKNNLLLGMFVFLGIIVFSVSIYLIGKKQNLFTSNVKIIAVYVGNPDLFKQRGSNGFAITNPHLLQNLSDEPAALGLCP